jgi:RimJ/RimL family protein N-acetyltransferase
LQGKGYGTEAVKLLLKFAFNDLNLNKVYLKVFQNNERAIKCYLKAGFVKEGLLRKESFIDGSYQCCLHGNFKGGIS